MFHLSPIRKIRTITLTNQRDINHYPQIRGNTELIVLIRNVSEPTFPISNRNLPIINRNLVDHPTTKIRDRYNHRHNECHLRMVSKQLHASIPTWAKHQVRLRITHPKQSDKQSPSQASLPATTTNSRKCYICNDPNHLANASSLGIEHKQMLRKILLLTAISWLYSSHLFLSSITKHALHAW